MDRPQEPYFRIFDGMGITHRREGDSPDGPGPAASRGVSHAGDVSSQFVTGLLFALPLLEGGEIIRLTSPLESRGYVDMTLQVLRDRGIRVEELPEGFPGARRPAVRPRHSGGGGGLLPGRLSGWPPPGWGAR